jgi:hypothetical protein
MLSLIIYNISYLYLIIIFGKQQILAKNPRNSIFRENNDSRLENNIAQKFENWFLIKK